MSLDPSKASRFGSSKVRTGCLTCVRRHLKCGEEKPVCHRCAKSSRNCLQRAQQDGSVESLRMIHYISRPATSLPFVPTKEPVELRCLEYFRLRTAPELAGVHDPDLWTNHIMQIVIESPAIWHATVALGALHEHFENSGTMSLRDQDLVIPLAQYGKAISSLCISLKDPSNHSVDLPLIACALFCAFESMGYHLHSALSHVTSGLRVLAERKLQQKQSRPIYPSLDLLSPLFTRLDTQRLELGDSSFPAQQPVVLPDIDFGILNDLNDARLKIDRVLNNLLHHIRKLRGQTYDPLRPRDLNADHQEIVSDPVCDYLRWASAFDHLLDSLKSEKSDLQSALVLQVWRIYVNIMLRVDASQGEVGFDAFLKDFAIMTGLIEEFVCWSIGYIGQADELFLIRDPNPLEEPLPEELQHQHRALVNNIPRWCGFVGIKFQDPSQKSKVWLESSAASESATKLLNISRQARIRSSAKPAGADPSTQRFKPTYTYAHGVVYLLYVTVARCRDPQTRRRAWRILYKCNRREGLWDSALAARLGQRLILIEESQAARDDKIEEASLIPNHARVRIIKPTFLPDKRSLERYFFGWEGSLEESVGAEQVWVEEGMEW